MEPKEVKQVMTILSTSYLLKKNGDFPTEKEIENELERRKGYISSFWKNPGGEAGFHKSMKELWLDPPEDFQ